MNATIVIPAHDEATAIATVVRGCSEADPRVRTVIVVDDGSRDDTARQAEAAGARVIRSEHHGKGHAVRCGAAAVDTDAIVFLDGDGQDDPADISRLLDALDAGADLAIGSRFLGRFAPGAITPINRLGNRVLTELVDRMWGVPLTDTQAGFRAIRRSLWSRLACTAMAYDIETEVLVRALQAGARVTEVPVTRRPRYGGRSGLHGLRDGTRILATMLRLRFVPP